MNTVTFKVFKMSVKAENRYKLNSLAAARKQNQELATKEILLNPRPKREDCHSTQSTWADKRSVRNWMRRNASEFQTATELAEACAIEFDFCGNDPLDDETHWIWDFAFESLFAQKQELRK